MNRGPRIQNPPKKKKEHKEKMKAGRTTRAEKKFCRRKGLEQARTQSRS